MRPHLLGHRQHGGHQKRGPINGVEANDVFAHKMQIRRPHAALLILRSAHCAEIRGERVEPHVENVRLFARNGNAPADRGTRNAKVLQPAFHETDDFIAARFRLDEIRILFVEIEERLLKPRKLKEIVFFRDRFRGPAAVGTVVARLRIVHEGIVVNAVLAGVVTLVDVTVFAAESKEPLHGSNVRQVRGTDEFIRGETQLIPQGAPLRGHLGNEGGLRHAGFFSCALDVNTMLVRARGHHHFVAAHALVAANGVRHYGRICVADVRQAVRVVDRRGQIKFGFPG